MILLILTEPSAKYPICLLVDNVDDRGLLEGETKMNLNELLFSKAKIDNINEMLNIINRCMNEVNYKDYGQYEFKKYLANFTVGWLADIINTRHYYEVWYQKKIVACGGVSRDYSQEKQSYFTAIFVNPDFRGKGIGRIFRKR